MAPPSDIRARQEHFLSLLDPHYDGFVRYVRAMTRNTEDARDIVGETMLVAFRQLDDIRNEESFFFYLIAIARRQHAKFQRRRWLLVAFGREHEELLRDTGTAPDAQPDIAILHEAIARLPLRMREAVVLFELSGLSLEEIRAIQGGSLSGVKARVARGRRKLAALLDDDAAHEDDAVQTFSDPYDTYIAEHVVGIGEIKP
ncbi:MAG: RNA polymerase sigma factor [Ignavibacteria bacterium]|nr:RNA polymerase sigma factor [Ignavibacteria bacterium]